MALLRRSAIGLTGFVGVTATLGGLELVTGFPVEQPTQWLEGTPFSTYLVPGIALAGVVGGSSLTALALAVQDRPGWPAATALAGAVLAGWIVGEVIVLEQPNAPTPVELSYLGLAATLIGLGSLARSRTHSGMPRNPWNGTARGT